MVDSLAADVASISTSIKGLATVNWSTYIGFAGIILSIVAMVGGAIFTGYSATQRRLEEVAISMGNRDLLLEFERGKADQQRTDLRISVTKLDVDLQREMRDVNATTEAKLTALDKRIQEEITRTSVQLTDSRKQLENIVDDLRRTSEQSVKDRAMHDARLQALERIAFPNWRQPLDK